MRFILLSLSWMIVAGATAWADFQVPPLTGPVVDQVGMLGPAVQTGLADYLQSLRQHGGTQIQVAILRDLGGLSIEEVGIRLGDSWKIGGQRSDNGIILIVAKAERQVRIEVGKGREGDLPDLVASRIIREVIVPAMKAGKPEVAVVQGVRAIVARSDQGFRMEDRPPPQGYESQRSDVSAHPGRVIVTLILILIILSFFNRGGGGGLWPLLLMGGRGGWSGGGWSGGGSWGGGSGGGWSGGGGGFSGGGASGSW